jgi:hypothetical protein
MGMHRVARGRKPETLRKGEIKMKIELTINKELRTQRQYNIAEKIEAAMVAKPEAFKKMFDITNHLTSEAGWTCDITNYSEGSYLKFSGCRSGVVVFLNPNGDAIRKPRGIVAISTDYATGSGTEIHKC